MDRSCMGVLRGSYLCLPSLAIARAPDPQPRPSRTGSRN